MSFQALRLHESGTTPRTRGEADSRNECEADGRCARFCTEENRLLWSPSLPAYLQTAYEALPERRFKKWSGRRGSNPRQPAWKAGTLPLSYSRRVGVRGLEPRTSWSQTKRATNCATPRFKMHLNYSMLLATCQALLFRLLFSLDALHSLALSCSS
jgi:hypothetical protein